MTQDKLSEDELDTLEACLRNGQPGRIMPYEIGQLIAGYRELLALRSATPMPEVKALEWDEVTQARSDEDPHREVIGWECPTGFDGFYIVEITGGGASLTTTNYDCTYYGSPDEAKAASQADFEQRIFSALTTPPAREISEAELERVKGERDEARSRFNDIDLCQHGQAPCEWALKLSARAERAEASLGVAVKALEEISSPAHTLKLLWWQIRAREALASIQAKAE
jgi:hypothetical protein